MSGSSISVSQAKAHLTALVERAANGEVITITRRGKPGATLGPVAARSGTAGTFDEIMAAQVNHVVKAIPGAVAKVYGSGQESTPAPRNAAPRPQTSSRLAPQPAGLTLADLLKASR